MLVCLVYDPQTLIRNRQGLQTDLENLSDTNMGVRIVISPCMF